MVRPITPKEPEDVEMDSGDTTVLKDLLIEQHEAHCSVTDQFETLITDLMASLRTIQASGPTAELAKSQQELGELVTNLKLMQAEQAKSQQ